MDAPKITVALPLYESGNIAWLCLESMCNMRNPMVPWEIIILEEETENDFGWINAMKYIQRIREKNGYIRYQKLDKRMPLATKWRAIADMASDSSEIFLMCAGDNYYQSNLLWDAWHAIINKGADWFQSNVGYFYDIDTKVMAQYRRRSLTGLDKAMRMELARKIEPSDRPRGIDLYVYRNVQPQKMMWNANEHGKFSLYTHGRNHISGDRRKIALNNHKFPFRESDKELMDLVPEYVAQRLNLVKDNGY